MNKEQVTKAIGKNEALVVAATYNILFTNDIVCGIVVETVSRVKNSPMYRHRTKQLLDQCFNERGKYEKLINGIIEKDSEFFANANDQFSEASACHLNVLYYSIKQEFDNRGIQNSYAISSIAYARTMCELACLQFDHRVSELYRVDNQFRAIPLDHLRLTNLLRKLNELVDIQSIPVKIDLNTPNCICAINAITQKLADADLIAKSIA